MMPITDHLPIVLRAYAEAAKAKPRHHDMGASAWTLVFDTETTTDAGQALRFGTYQLRNGESLDEAGLFFDPDGISDGELATLSAFAKRECLVLRTRDEFVDEVFFGRAYQLRSRIVGFNLPFDISRIAINHGPARGAMYGGFTFTLSHQKIWPHLRVKHLSRRCALMSFAAPFRQRDSRGQRNRGARTPIRRGYFVDINTLASALLSQGFTLGSLSAFLNVPNPKLDFDQFDGPVTDAMLTYAVRDSQTTWECYAALIERLDRLGMPDLRPEEIYSEASIGKGYLAAMGIKPWRQLQPDFPPGMLGRIMATYFGGRSEIRIRREVRQVILCDFLSMYPTVCTLMGLWRFVTANGMTWRDATTETRALLARIDDECLQRPEAWHSLATLVRVVPDGNIFPVRAAYDGDAQATIGTNYLSAENSMWFTLADCIASKLLAGKAPEILEAITFEPGTMQAELQPIDVNGNPNYHVDPVTTDFFRRTIELRKETQGRMKVATGDDREALDTEQHALKICANSTSYGIWMQVNVAKKAKKFAATVHAADGAAFERDTDKAEKPGEYFHPLLASLITGAARLMLAITECQIAANGLEWAFCDTDSMAIAKPDGIAGEDFRQRVDAIVAWFEELNPYDFGGSILKVEGENFSLEGGEPEPLYCWAVSSKRYALFNLGVDGQPVLRKVSAHGLGHLRPPYSNDDAPGDTPPPPQSVLRRGVKRWHCDLWFQIVAAAIAEKPDTPNLEFHPAMSAPAISRYGATAPELLRWFDGFNANRPHREQVKPFGFLLALRAKPALIEGKATLVKSRRGRPPKFRPVKPVAPFDTDLGKVAVTAFDREAGKPVPAEALQTYTETLAQYHLHPESKFRGGDYLDRGTTTRRHILVGGVCHIGKEANEWERQAMLRMGADVRPEYGISDDTLARLRYELTALAHRLGNFSAAQALRVSPKRLASIRSGEVCPDLANAHSLFVRLAAASAHAEIQDQERAAKLQHLRKLVSEIGLRSTARKLCVDPSNLRRTLARASDKKWGP